VTALDALIVINRLNAGQTEYQNPDALSSYFRELDELEIASNLAFQTAWTTTPPTGSLTDEALLALLLADADDSDSEAEDDLFAL
jgi:hypothetical protein